MRWVTNLLDQLPKGYGGQSGEIWQRVPLWLKPDVFTDIIPKSLRNSTFARSLVPKSLLNYPGGRLLVISVLFQLCWTVTVNHGYQVLSCGFNGLPVAAIDRKTGSNSQPWLIAESPTELLENSRCRTQPRPSDSQSPGMESGCVCLFVLTFFPPHKAPQECPPTPTSTLKNRDMFLCFS